MRTDRIGPASTRHSGRVFAFTLAGGFAFVALMGAWKDLDMVTRGGVLLALGSLLAGVFFPGRLEPARRAWMAIGEAMGLVTTPLLMGIVYYVVLTPTGLIRRGLVRRPRSPASFWQARPPLPPKSRLERQF